MILPPSDLTPEIISARSNLAIEMMMNSADVADVIREAEAGQRPPDSASRMLMVYCYAILLAGIDGPKYLLDPARAAALRAGLSEYPATVRKAAAQATADALREMGATL